MRFAKHMSASTAYRANCRMPWRSPILPRRYSRPIYSELICPRVANHPNTQDRTNSRTACSRTPMGMAPVASNEFRAGNLWLTAYIVSLGFAFPEIELHKGRAKFTFVDPSGELSWAAEEFALDDPDGNKCLISARRL